MLRYLTDAYRTLRQTVPERHRTPELEDLVEWLGETVRQTDSSLLDEWEALADPDARPRRRRRTTRRRHRRGRSPRRTRPFRVMVRNAMLRRVELAARDDVDGLAALEARGRRPTDPPLEVVMTRVGLGRGARGLLRRARRDPARRRRPRARRCWRVEDDRPGVAGPADPRTTRRATTTG